MNNLNKFRNQTRSNLQIFKTETPFSRFIIFSAILFFYFQIISLFYIAIQNFTVSNNSFRISVQSINGISQQPNALAIPISGLAFIIVLIMFNKLISSTNAIALRRIVRIIYPSIYLLLILLYRLAMNFQDLIGQNALSLKAIIADAAQGTIWGLLLLINLILIISPIIAKFINSAEIKRYDFIGFTLPIVLFLSHQIISIVAQELNFNETYYRQGLLFRLLIFLVCIFIYLSVARSIVEDKYITLNNFIPFLVFILTFLVLFLRIPSFVYSYRPTFIPIAVKEPRILCFILLFSLVLAFIAWRITSLNGNYLLSLGGLFYTFSVPFEKIIVPNLDSYHYGEYVGLWFNTKTQNLQPYTEIEYPRGLFVNYFPGAIGNFLSPGNPEFQNFWLIILGYLTGFGLVYLLSFWLPTHFSLLLILLLPFPNNYVEIDYISFSFVLTSLILLKKQFFLIGSVFIFLSAPLLILAFPGQGLISSALMGVVLIKYRANVARSIKGKLLTSLLIFSLIAIFYVLVFPMLFSAIKWVLRNSVANAQYFGDGWVNKFLFSENFPVSLRWLTLTLLPLLFFFYLNFEKSLQLDEKTLLAVGVIYLILISGRWYGRTDFEILSRVGVGGLTFVALIVLPLFWRILYERNILGLLVIFSITFALAAPYKSINLNYVTEDKSATSIISFNENSDYNKYGNNLLKLKNQLHNFFGENPKVINLTGGSASDYYMQIPSIGGVQSPYMIIDSKQEDEWLTRLERSTVAGFYGPYGGFGGIKADGTTIGGRAPKVLKWLMKNFDLIKCDDSYIGVKNVLNLGESAQACSKPKTAQENLDYWDKMNGSSTRLGNSLAMWARGLENTKRTISLQNLETQTSNSRFIGLNCSGGFTDQELRITGKSKEGEYISTLFYANLIPGTMILSSEIFPINNLVEGDLKLTSENDSCIPISAN